MQTTSDQVRFSILIPTYNRGKLIVETIDSVLSQTFRSFEIIVIDDGSTDATLDVLAAYAGQIKILRQANQGPEQARRLAATVATGEYFVMLDSDDLMLPWALATYERIIRECDAPALIVGLLSYFRSGEKSHPNVVSPKDICVLRLADFLAKKIPVGLSSSNIVVRKQIFEQSGASQSTFKTFPMDTVNYMLMFGTFNPCVIVQQPYTVAYRVHEGNTINNVANMLRAIQFLVTAENQGLYRGGRQRRFDRWALIGGSAWSWIVKGVKHGNIGLAASTLLRFSPMVAVGIIRKLWFCLQGATATICLTGTWPDM